MTHSFTWESVLTSCITVWYGNCSAADRKTLQRTVNTAAKIIGAPLPSILDIFLARCSSKTNSIVKDPTHPSHSLFQLLPSGRRLPEHQSPLRQTAQQLFPPGCESPQLKSPRPPLKPHANPYLLKHGPPTCSGMTIKLNLNLNLIITQLCSDFSSARDTGSLVFYLV